jgi:hypothetical protein
MNMPASMSIRPVQLKKQVAAAPNIKREYPAAVPVDPKSFSILLSVM